MCRIVPTIITLPPLALLEAKKEALKEAWANGNYVKELDNAAALGQVILLSDILEVDFVENSTRE